MADADSADDVEQRHDFLNLFFEVAAAEVSRYEGVINQFREEGFVALFGAPIAQEHHARRAEKVCPGPGLGLGLCTGVNSGEVIVGSTGADSRMNYTPVGDTARAAGTLQERARGGQILISDTTVGWLRAIARPGLWSIPRSPENPVAPRPGRSWTLRKHGRDWRHRPNAG